MIFLVELFIAAVSLAGLIALASVLAWLIPVALVVLVVRQLRRSAQIARFEADVQEGRRTSIRDYGCPECPNDFKLCDACAQSYLADNPA